MILKMFPTNSRVNVLSRGWSVCQTSDTTAKNENGSEDVQKIERSIAYMTQHLNQPVRVAELAAQANVSPSHYFALFKRKTGRAPIDYFTGLRMQRARTLLDSTTASVKEIAVDLGYKDPFYFSRVFKSVNLAAPTRYRARQKARPADEFPKAIGLPDRSGKISRTFDSAPRFNGVSNYQFA
jgi:transcriptional regulator GlxA family with amidase domain